MRTVTLALLGCLALSSHASIGGGKLQQLHVESEYVSDRDISVWLPDGYRSTIRYAVLYMNDGQNLFDSTATWNGQEWQVDETLSRLIAQDSIQPLIVVAIPNNVNSRRSEYFPQSVIDSIPEPQKQELLDLLPGGPRADDYLRFVVTEVKPLIDSTFSTFADLSHTFVCGSSSGALSALYALCEYPQVFAGAACLSTHWTGIPYPNTEIPHALLNYLARKLPPSRNHRLYFDYGGMGLDVNYAPSQALVDALGRNKGYDGSNWLTRSCSEWEHTEKSWAERFPDAVIFLAREQTDLEPE